jgi:hypothetical protein
MAGFEAAQATLEIFAQANLPAVLPVGFLIDWENAGTFREPNPPVLWGRWSIRELTTGQIDLVRTAWVETQGQVQFQIFAPKGSGTRAMRAVADDFAGVFDGQKIGNVQCRRASLSVQPDQPGGWLQGNVSLRFYFRVQAT